jgi:CMP/dCMP kinase
LGRVCFFWIRGLNRKTAGILEVLLSLDPKIGLNAPPMTSEKSSIIIAIDGPAASGKGTLAKRLANFYGFAHLDTGILYRGVGYLVLAKGKEPRDEAVAADVARNFSLEQFHEADIRTAEVARAASLVAAMPEVRAALLDFQRHFAHSPPAGFTGAVLDGRDIGTIVCPEALIKFYITASPEVRAERRWLELRLSNPGISVEQVLDDLKRRDARDSGRDAAPLRPATGAELIDTSHLTADEVFARAQRLVDNRLKTA